jgi:hypothetical protein
MKKQLIKEVDIKGKVWYWTELDGEKVTPFSQNEEEAINEFNAFIPTVPTKEVIKEEEI